MSDQREVEVSEGATELAYRSLDGTQLEWLASAPPRRKAITRKALQAAAPVLCAEERERLGFTEDDVDRLGGIAGELENLPADARRHFDQDGRDARYLRLVQKRVRDFLKVSR